MAFIGKTPTPVPLTSSDIPDLPATKITSGTFPALNASNLTNLDAADLSGTLPALNGSALTNVSAGKVLNTYHVTKTDSQTINATVSTVFQSPNITPVSTSSKFMINVSLNHASTNPNGAILFFREVGGSYSDLTPTQSISGGGNFASTGNCKDCDNPTHKDDYGMETWSATFQDAPNTTSQINYTLRFSVGSGQTVYINRVAGDANYKGMSGMTILEISS